MSPLPAELHDAARTASHQVRRVRAALGRDPGKVPVVRLEGPIMAPAMTGGIGGRAALNLAAVEPVLKRAFETDGAVAVALSINSPGGSPAQSELLGARIRQLAEKHDLPVLAFCEDVAASGGYWLACAADEIYVASTSIVGSIGVISASFGAKGLIEKVGLERRVFTAGEAKSRLDMFEDVRADDVQWLHGVQEDIHGAFRGWVTERRGDRLADDPTLFTGEVWIGAASVEVGLADGVATLRSKLAELYPDADIDVISSPKPLLARLLASTEHAAVGGASVALATGLAGAAAKGLVAGALGELRSRGLWANYGL